MIALFATTLRWCLNCVRRRVPIQSMHSHECRHGDRRAVIGGERWLTHAPLDYFALDKLTAKGLRANTDVGQPHDSSRPLIKLGDVAVGSWACTTGGWNSPSPRASTEVFYMLAGEGSVDDADGTRHRFGPGDLVTLPRGWSGRWDVTSSETLHKVWAVHTHPEISGASTAAVVTTPEVKKRGMPWSKGAGGGASHKSVYNVGKTAVSVWSEGAGQKAVDDHKATECLHVLEGTAFLTNADGTAYRCVAGDNVVLPKGWSGSFDIVDALKVVSVAVGDQAAAPPAPSGAPSSGRRPIVGGNWKCNPADFSELPALVANINACDRRVDVYVSRRPAHRLGVRQVHQRRVRRAAELQLQGVRRVHRRDGGRPDEEHGWGGAHRPLGAPRSLAC